jgi:N-acetylated-alpha-linked acidic dipeptidase
MAGVFGIEVLHMADADVLPYDYVLYAKEISGYLEQAKKHSMDASLPGMDFSDALTATDRLSRAAKATYERQLNPGTKAEILDAHLRAVEDALLNPSGLPHRAWYRHTIFAPGEYTGYDAVVIPGVNEAINSKDAQLTIEQLAALTDALNRAAILLEQIK